VFWKQRLNPPPPEAAGEAPAGRSPMGARALVAPAPSIRTSLGADTVVNGRLSFTAPTRIEGTLRGEVRASDMLVVGETAIVEGVVRALTLVILGEVRGEVWGAERVEIGRSGRVTGKVEAQSLVLREGGLLNADCRIVPTRTTVQVFRAAPERIVESR
jgi:cytoskeletal protein CcmA (bactofilin family)